MADNIAGLSATEHAVLETLCVLGESSAGLLAKRSGLKRPTVYAALDGLKFAGLIQTNRARGAMLYRALSAREIRALLLEKVERSYARESSDIDRLVKKLETIAVPRSVELSGYEVDAIESGDEVHSALKKLLVAGNYAAIFNPQIVIQGAMKGFLQRCLAENAKIGSPIRELCVPGKMTTWYKNTISNPNHEVRLLTQSTDVVSDIILSQGTVYLLHYERNRELGIRIRQADCFRSMFSMFEICWDASA